MPMNQHKIGLPAEAGFLAGLMYRSACIQKTGYQLLILLASCFAPVATQADPPRPLNTTFADYARQQQQQDARLLQSKAGQEASPAKERQVAPAQVAPGKHPGPDANARVAPTLTPAGKSAKSTLPININQADEATLGNTLKGVGPAKARAIIEYRQAHGGFKSIDELLEVKGIGPATLEKNRHLIRLN